MKNKLLKEKLQHQKRRLRRRRPIVRWKKCNPVRKKKNDDLNYRLLSKEEKRYFPSPILSLGAASLIQSLPGGYIPRVEKERGMLEVPWLANQPSIVGNQSMIFAMSSISLLGSLVWGHHMYTVGLESDTRAYFTGVTILISLPTGTKISQWKINY